MKSLDPASGHIVTLQIGDTDLDGVRAIPKAPCGIVVLAQGNSSSRFCRRNQLVARTLNDAGFATLLFDLLTTFEEAADGLTRHLRFNIPLLAERLTGAVDWLRQQAEFADFPIGLFTSNTGAAAALHVAAHRQGVIGAVISHRGNPELAGEFLSRVQAPVLLIVEDDDRKAMQRNRKAGRLLRRIPEFETIPRAALQDDEIRKLDEVARLACCWFLQKLTDGSPP